MLACSPLTIPTPLSTQKPTPQVLAVKDEGQRWEDPTIAPEYEKQGFGNRKPSDRRQFRLLVPPPPFTLSASHAACLGRPLRLRRNTPPSTLSTQPRARTRHTGTRSGWRSGDSSYTALLALGLEHHTHYLLSTYPSHHSALMNVAALRGSSSICAFDLAQGRASGEQAT
ncbi:hypothetical protein GALMADRAFT_216750 [Galerina marginata CBS 339.88]|uniref:Uncharacterized protein n=1 Tax=Galerina marginata (strain CBS 339.88) TaxID=685588 RepID=A0A067SAB1_GALM3|nr:hypothetical protein GALMADRAFT_216750 [Galerina marginata CBS 339.88]